MISDGGVGAVGGFVLQHPLRYNKCRPSGNGMYCLPLEGSSFSRSTRRVGLLGVASPGGFNQQPGQLQVIQCGPPQFALPTGLAGRTAGGFRTCLCRMNGGLGVAEAPYQMACCA